VLNLSPYSQTNKGNIFADMILAEHSKDPIPRAFLKDILVFIGVKKFKEIIT
jgi:hypothetical protein